MTVNPLSFATQGLLNPSSAALYLAVQGALQLALADHNFFATGILTGFPVLDEAELTFESQDLVPTGIETGAPSIPSPTLRQTHVLTATGIVTSAPVTGSPLLAVLYALTPTGITTGPAVLDTPTFRLVHVLLATDIDAGAPIVPSPELVTIVNFSGTGVTTGSPTVSLATLAQVHALIGTPVSAGNPIVSSPALSQFYDFTATGITTAPAEVAQPVLVVVFNLASTEITTGSPTLDAAVLEQVHQLMATAVLAGAPYLDHATFVMQHNLAAVPLLTGAALVDAAALYQNHVLAGVDVLTGSPTLGTPEADLIYLFTGTGIETGPSIIFRPKFSQRRLRELLRLAQPELPVARIPEGFPELKFATVQRPGPGMLLLRWGLNPTAWDLADIAFQVFRSGGIEGPWDLITELPSNTFSWYDTDVVSSDRVRSYHYLVRVVSKAGRGVRDPELPARLQHEQDAIALEMVRKKTVFLTKKSAVGGFVFTRRASGPLCSRCYNAERGVSADDDCPECYGTGFTGGYFTPVQTPMLLNPSEQAVVDAGVPYHRSSTYCEIANSPPVNIGDLIVDAEVNIRYEVTAVAETTHRGATVSQILSLTRVDEASQLYTLPLPEAPDGPYKSLFNVARFTTSLAPSETELHAGEGFPTFCSVEARRLGPALTSVEWSLHPTDWSLEDIRYEVFRSTGLEGPWESVAFLPAGQTLWRDTTTAQSPSIRDYFYRIRASSFTGQGYADSPAVWPSHPVDAIAKEMIRKRGVFLGHKSGIGAAVLVRRTEGPTCSRCYEAERGQAGDADCPECYGTGFTGGYLNPVEVPLLFNPGEISQTGATLSVELGATPVIRSGDLVADLVMNIRYRVESVHPTTHRMAVVAQLATLSRLDENDVAYRIPLKDETGREESIGVPTSSGDPGLPDFRTAWASRAGPSLVAVRWSLLPHSLPEAELSFQIFRSSGPAGPWEAAGDVPGGRFLWSDTEVVGPGVDRMYYYRIRVTAPQGFRDSPPVAPAHPLDHIALELIRKKNVFLRARSGINVAVLLRRNTGAKCSRCYNAERGVPSDDDCPECYGTGFTGGYLAPVFAAALYNPPRQTLVSAGVQMAESSTYFELANYPFLDAQDVIVDLKLNTRYYVTRVHPTARRMAVVSQIVSLVRADENDIIYTVPLPESTPDGRHVGS